MRGQDPAPHQRAVDVALLEELVCTPGGKRSRFLTSLVHPDIDRIARSGGRTEDRRTRAKQRIDQFRSDLAKQFLQPGVAERIRDQLRTSLGDTINNPRNLSDIATVFQAALDKLSDDELLQRRRGSAR
jgi:hypothetical protein